MRVVDYGDPPPPDLALAWKCQRWGALPSAGGILDQDYATLHRMTVLLNVYETVARLRSLVGKQIHSLSSSERRLIKWLLDEGILTNGRPED